MPATRQQRKEILTALFMFFDNDPDDPIFLCFAHHRICNVLDIISYGPSMLADLKYIPLPPKSDSKEDPDDFKQVSKIKPTPIPLEPQFQVQIKIIQGYVSHCLDIGSPIHDTFHLITQEDIDNYRVSNKYKV